MGIVNEYIDKIVKFIKKENYEYPWQQYYKDMPRHLNYFEGSIYDKLKFILHLVKIVRKLF